MSYNLKIVEYQATGECEIHFYSNPIQTEINDEERRKNSKGEPDPQRSKKTSYNRTKNKVYDYARANTWDYFLTFTFNPEQTDRYSYEETSKKMAKWFNNMRQRKAPNLKYIAVPEQHKDGAYHFHALVSNIGEISLTDSLKRTKQGDIIYNLPNYKYGYTTATTVKDSLRASNYITKYITKEMCQVQNRKRYWNSKNLEQGQEKTQLISKEQVEVLKNAYRASAKKSKKIEVNGGDFYMEKEILTCSLERV